MDFGHGWGGGISVNRKKFWCPPALLTSSPRVWECVCVFCLFVCCMSALGCPELHCCSDLERVLWQKLLLYQIYSAISSLWEFLAEPIREGVVKARIVVAVFYQARMLWEKLEDKRRASKETPGITILLVFPFNTKIFLSRPLIPVFVWKPLRQHYISMGWK